MAPAAGLIAGSPARSSTASIAPCHGFKPRAIMMAAVPTLLVSLVARSNAQGEGIIGGASAHDPATSILLATGDCDGEVSYNGICTPASFPPRQNYSRAVPHPPYLDNPPALINITVGRQLFVDSFLIANTSGTQQQFHAAKYHEENPVLKPDQPWEGTFAMPFSGGAWWEDKEDRLALWYRCGGGYASQQSEGESSSTGRSGPTTTGTCVAYSSDGVHFSKPLQDVVPNTNFVRQVAFDGNTVWLDELQPAIDCNRSSGPFFPTIAWPDCSIHRSAAVSMAIRRHWAARYTSGVWPSGVARNWYIG